MTLSPVARRTTLTSLSEPLPDGSTMGAVITGVTGPPPAGTVLNVNDVGPAMSGVLYEAMTTVLPATATPARTRQARGPHRRGPGRRDQREFRRIEGARTVVAGQKKQVPSCTPRPGQSVEPAGPRPVALSHDPARRRSRGWHKAARYFRSHRPFHSDFTETMRHVDCLGPRHARSIRRACCPGPGTFHRFPDGLRCGECYGGRRRGVRRWLRPDRAILLLCGGAHPASMLSGGLGLSLCARGNGLLRSRRRGLFAGVVRVGRRRRRTFRRGVRSA